VVQVANANIDRAIRRVSVARGHDPRQFTLVAFGGAGPLHACEVAERLDIPRVLVPPTPGVLCALGLLVADVTLDFSRSVLGLSDAARAALLETMTGEARAALAREGFREAEMLIVPTLDARYAGQAYELSIPYGDDIEGAFHAAHERAYGHALRDRAVEVVNLRVHAVGLVEKPAFAAAPIVPNDGSEALLGYKPTVYADSTTPTALYDRGRLQPGAAFAGAALVFQYDSTVFIPPGWSARVDGYGNLILNRP
jgi:N-methylhydantoinase A